MSRIGGLISCRMASRRLPGKALKTIGAQTLIEHVIARMQAVPSIDQIVLCTTFLPEDRALVELCDRLGVATYCGDVTDVMGRLIGAAAAYQVDTIVRITGDNPLVCHLSAEEAIRHHIETGADFTRIPEMPVGTQVNVVETAALKKAHRLAEDLSGSEYLAYYLDQPEHFKVEHLAAPDSLRRPEYRLTVDTEDDLRLIRNIYARLDGPLIDLRDVVRLLDGSSELRQLNASSGATKVGRDQVNARLRHEV